MTALRTIRLVAEREARDRFTNKAFLLTTAVMVLGVIAIVVLPAILGDDDGPTLGVVGDAAAGFEETAQLLAGAQEVDLTITDLATRDDAAAAIEAGDVDAAYLAEADELLAEGMPPGTLQTIVDAARQQAATSAALGDAGLTPEQLAGLLEPVAPVTVVDLEGEAADGDAFGLDYLIASVAAGLLFFIVVFNTTSLMTVALEEKSNRVVEVLVAAVRPWQLLAGKILAMTLLSVAQLGLLIGAGLGANAVVGAAELPQVGPAMLVVTVLMLVVGFLFYASLYAVAGSMASSMEDAQSTSGPLNFLLVGAWIGTSFFVMPQPTGTIAQVLSFVPFTAPFAIPARIAFDAISPLSVVIGSVVTTLAALVTVRLAGRLYASVLLAGSKISWRSAWGAEAIR